MCQLQQWAKKLTSAIAQIGSNIQVPGHSVTTKNKTSVTHLIIIGPDVGDYIYSGDPNGHVISEVPLNNATLNPSISFSQYISVLNSLREQARDKSRLYGINEFF